MTPPVFVETADIHHLEDPVANVGDDELLNSQQTFDGVSTISESFQQNTNNPSMTNFADFAESSSVFSDNSTTDVKQAVDS